MATYEDKLTLEAWNGKLGKVEILRDENIGTLQSQTSVDLSEINWAEWTIVGSLLRFDSFASVSNVADKNTLSVRLFSNGSLLNTYGGLNNPTGSQKYTSLLCFVTPCRDPGRKIRLIVLPGADMAVCDETYRDLTELRFCMGPDATLRPFNMHLLVFGVR